MHHPRRLLEVLFVSWLAIGCARPQAPEPEPTSAGREVVTARAPVVASPPAEGPDTPAAPPPASASGIEPLLRARHTDDLPSRAQLDAHADAFEGLSWLAHQAEAQAVRVRACQAMGLYPEHHPASDLASLATADQPGAVRAGALEGLSRLPLSDRESASSTIRTALADADPRVSLAAVRAARGVAPLAPALREAATSHPDPRVREAAAKL